MIVRIMGEGQFDCGDVNDEALQRYDNEVEAAVDSGDDDAVREALARLRAFVFESAEPVADDYLGPSDFVIPFADAHIAQIKELLTGEGFIPDVV
ncbi:hypothetical protein BRM1_12510 [Brevibacterium sp. BRM-1]|uniref:PspA-associated protein PspAA n=1 Tax=Brevibacterium sp. BRM-1 TaxID=2999062 RepID=UPI002280517A|nr:hypothetical protein [Brevibacterium sp. BRM-1]WAL40038.1 hypothetical protein BRM1_12510 [Brevibacterium sp. BRM-1]